MENLTHTLTGVILGKAGLEKQTPLATPALIIAANLPDLDILGSVAGVNYLDFHRGVSHAAVGIAVLSVALAGGFWLFGKRSSGTRIRESSPIKQRIEFVPMLYVCFVGLLSHPLLDYLNAYGVRPWLPFSDKKYYGDLIGIVDPWIWIVLGVSICAGVVSKRAKIAWACLWFVLAFLVFLGLGPVVALMWGSILCAALFLGLRLKARRYCTAKAGLCVLLIYVGLTALTRGWIMHKAMRQVSGTIREAILAVDVLPQRPGAPWRWTVVVETPERYHLAPIGLRDWKSAPPTFESYSKNLQEKCYRAAMADEEMSAMARFARFPAVEVVDSPGQCLVFLRDLRYAQRQARGWGVASTTVLK